MAQSRISGRAIRLDRANIDTDLIIPASYMKRLDRDGLAAGAFEALRESPDNPFDDPRFAGAQILVAGANFGCGSSREHAVWAIQQIGIRAILAPSFASIFEANALRNGLVPVRLPGADIEELMRSPPEAVIGIDVAGETVVLPGGRRVGFTLDPFRKHCLLEGVDGVGIGLSMLDRIEAHEAMAARERPWEQQVPWDRLEEDL